MVFEPAHRKDGDLISSREWNNILDELVDLRKFIENMTRSVTLTSLSSPIGTSYNLKGVKVFDFNVDVMGLITKQYYLGPGETGDICRFGIHDFADIIYYWSCAAKSDKEAIIITLEYIDETKVHSEKLFIHEWSTLRDKGKNNPYIEYMQNKEVVWYKYVFENPHPDNEIRYITFEGVNSESTVSIANLIQYATRLKQITTGSGKK